MNILTDTYAHKFSEKLLKSNGLKQLHEDRFMLNETLSLMESGETTALFFIDFSVLIINRKANSLELIDPDSAMHLIMNQHPFDNIDAINMIPEHLLKNPH